MSFTDAPAKADNGSSTAPRFPSCKYSEAGVKVIGEIGINHNGSVKLAKELISICHSAGCTYVKFQKRNPDVCVPEAQKTVMRKVRTYVNDGLALAFSSIKLAGGLVVLTFCVNSAVEFIARCVDPLG